MNRFFEEHPTLASALGVILFLASIALLSLLAGCKPQQHIVEIVKMDTLHVYHTDTLKVVHNDTVYSVVTQVVHDSIVKETIIKEVVNELGEVIHSEKETNNEVFHNSVTDSQLIQHTVDSLVQAKVDSIYQSKHEDKPVIVEVKEPTPWYQKTWNWIVGKFAWLGFFALVLILFAIFKDKIIKLLKKLIKGKSII